MFKHIAIFPLLISLLSVSKSFAQTNDPASAPTLTSSNTCVTTGGTLAGATDSGIPSKWCKGDPDDDVWYKFVAVGANTTISLNGITTGSNNLGNNLAVVEIFYSSSGTSTTLSHVICGAMTSSGTSLSVNACLIPGSTYFVRIFSAADGIPSGSKTFNICVTHPAAITAPGNDDCSAATSLTIGSATTGTVWGATATASIPVPASGTPDDDVWYRFTATAAITSTAIVSLSSVGSNLTDAGAVVEVFSGTCAGLVSIGCGYGSVKVTGLTNTNTYYVRVYSGNAGCIGGVSAGSAFSITVAAPASFTPVTIDKGRMKEVFQQTTLSGSSVLNDPWDITYGSDGYLWVTESKGYRVQRIDPATGFKTVVLDIGFNSQFLPAADRQFNLQFNFSAAGNPQGGLAGLVIHPDFMKATNPKNYVYLSYIHKYVTYGTGNAGVFFTNQLVQFTYNTTTGKLESPVSLCDTLPGSSDHNSQRMIIAPIGSTYYLFYASGDMGSGQFGNSSRTIKSQNKDSYEGKILRFNLESDGDSDLDAWIPNANPFNTTTPAKQSAVWATGIRNNQGFAYAKINSIDYLYGSSHGPFSDDEVNILEQGANYGHPLVIGSSTDGNYDGAKAGPASGSLPLIVSEATNASTIGTSYRDPIFKLYAPLRGNTTTSGTIQYIYSQVNGGNNDNSQWPSEAPSGMDIYSGSLIPGWKNSLVLAALKWGKIIKLKLNTSGSAITPTAGSDTVVYFDSQNRFRDIAFSPDGKDLYVIMDKSSATSGPSTNNPSVVACPGCLQKYTFLGYSDASGQSTIPTAIDIATSTSTNSVINGTTITIDATNNNLWVPITGPDGNILAEIKANGNNLGTVTSTFYLHSGTMRENASKRLYMNRSITITPQNQPTSTVNVRLYVTTNELNQIITATSSQGMPSGVTGINNIRVWKNNDANSTALTLTPTTLVPSYAQTHSGTSLGGYVIGVDVGSFSSFYFGNPSMTVLPLELVSFKATPQNDAALLKWETEHEFNTDKFAVERSIDGRNFEAIGDVKAKGQTDRTNDYSYVDQDASAQASLVYYRLKMLDNDGGYQYSKVVTVSFDNAAISIYPNPIKNQLNIQLNMRNSDEVKILISDMQGRVVYSQNKIVKAGNNEIQINTSSMPAQSYTVQVIGRNNKLLMSKKVVKR